MAISCLGCKAVSAFFGASVSILNRRTRSGHVSVTTAVRSPPSTGPAQRAREPRCPIYSRDGSGRATTRLRAARTWGGPVYYPLVILNATSFGTRGYVRERFGRPHRALISSPLDRWAAVIPGRAGNELEWTQLTGVAVRRNPAPNELLWVKGFLIFTTID
ncbi:hypothetical protein EVAR_103505_1 [Eumeta japonica]|uniref:Uncharacterized protein n=1 Tax=Eumeta variegata TaxID=151549 RepID=A0A4C1YV26_EUMVA|nr:hypothetical protein EVAR_103505_1 [Eumeta japonica]